MGAFQVLNIGVIFLGTLISMAYVFLYGFTARWWKTFIGQQHLAISALLAVLYARSATLVIMNWNELSPPRISTFTLAVLVTGAIVWGFVNYVRLQFWRRKKVND